MRTDPTFWILARAGGITAYVLIVCSVLAGLVLKSRPLGSLVRPAAVTGVHRFLTLLALVATGVHGIALYYDTKVPVDLLGLVVPGRVAYRPLWTGVGVVAAELALAIYLSFRVRRRIGVRNWRRLHWLTYGVFVAVTLHGLFAGSDSGAHWMKMVYLAAFGSVTFATAWRALVPPTRPAPARERRGEGRAVPREAAPAVAAAPER